MLHPFPSDINNPKSHKISNKTINPTTSTPSSMAMASSSLLHFLSLLSLLPFTTTTTTTLPLSHFTQTPFPSLTHLVSASLARAHHLKNPQTTPLSSHSYGGYSISLRFGTPPQTIPFVADTGSDLVWFPCTHRYKCNNCPISPINTNPSNTIPSFIPKLSSTSKILGCANPKCSWIHEVSDIKSRCSDCDVANMKNCTQICPPYLIFYGSGTTGGIMLTDTLNLPSKRVPEFAVGCSVFSSRQPAGIAGLGRGPPSLPSQLGLNKFSYCLLSRRFDDTSKTSSLVLETGSKSGTKTPGVVYTPFAKNPSPATGKTAFSVYYYVNLRKITIGETRIKIPYNHLTPDSNGNGGTIIDSGATFTYFTGDIFELVAGEFEKQVKNYTRATDVEALTGLRPCFNTKGHKTLSFPELALHFKGGADVALPVENYLVTVGDNDVACLTMVTDNFLDKDTSGGPSIILGNFQQQNFYVEYDLKNERLGFKQQNCK